MKRLLLIAILTVSAAGCASTYVRDGRATQAEIDTAACYSEAIRASAGLTGLLGALTYQQAFEQCMRAKGYKPA